MPETEKCYRKQISLFLKYLAVSELDEDTFLTKPYEDILNIVLCYLGSVRRADGLLFKQNSFLQMKWALKRYIKEKTGQNIDCDPRTTKVMRNMRNRIIHAGRGGSKHHDAITPQP